MFRKDTKNLWTVVIALIVLVGIMLIMQAQILIVVRDLRTSFFEGMDWNFISEADPFSQESLQESGLIDVLNSGS